MKPNYLFLAVVVNASYGRLGVILRFDIGDLTGIYQFLSVELLQVYNELIGRPSFPDLSILDLRDRGLSALDGSSNFRLRHAKPLEFENDILDVHERRL